MHGMRRGVQALALLSMMGVLPWSPATAQQAPVAADAWDSPRALDLVDRARLRRLVPQQDTLLRNYRARAEGFIYFYLDRKETDERTLVKVDQVALEVFWAPPNQTKQRIVGLRDAARFPNRMHYHLDHLTVIQDGFGDVIRMGDGDEVGDVPHPAAPGSDSIYEFRLTDSLTLRLPGPQAPIRVYELQVRPRRADRPALVGSVFVDRAGGDIVRMTFTFTPASYVDRRLDYISVSLDNGLWEGRYWLPNEQTLQIRRQVPELDFGAGAVIHGRMRITDYVFNDSLPATTFTGSKLTAVPRAARLEFDFERGIYDDMNELGLPPPTDLARVRQQAAAILGTSRLSGLPALRVNIGSASSAFRYNRAEGVAVGAGLAYVPGPSWRAEANGGYAFGAQRGWAMMGMTAALGSRSEIRLRADLNEVGDMGIVAGVAPALNTLSALFLGRDYLDPYRATGVSLGTRHSYRSLRATADVGGERHRSAALTQQTALFSDSAHFRAVKRVDHGDLVSLMLGLERPVLDARSVSWGAGLQLEAGMFENVGFLRPGLSLSVRRASADHAHGLQLRAAAGGLVGGAPAQRLFLLGGVGTLPGFEYRGFAGTRYVFAESEATLGVLRPWLGLRLLGAAGMTAGLQPDLLPCLPPQACTGPGYRTRSPWQVRTSDGVRFSAGAGVSLFWDVLRADVARGVNGGRWQLLLSVHRDLRDIS
jgi:hypothetical protein